eukprot:294078-Amphidinium_carterae.1
MSSLVSTYVQPNVHPQHLVCVSAALIHVEHLCAWTNLLRAPHSRGARTTYSVAGGLRHHGNRLDSAAAGVTIVTCGACHGYMQGLACCCDTFACLMWLLLLGQ